LIYNDLGRKLIDISDDYDENWKLNGDNLFAKYYAENYYKECDKVEKPEFLDTVLFKNSKGIINHGGIVLNYGKFIHTCKAGTVISRFSDSKFRMPIAGFYRLKDDKSKIHT
jgi:hypothetical protein